MATGTGMGSGVGMLPQAQYERVIPSALLELPQWVTWKYTMFPGEKKPRKVPYNARTGNKASTTNPQTWAPFRAAYKRAVQAGHSGVGVVTTKATGIVGIDLDGCRDLATGAIEAWAQSIVEQMDSYTEVSPSGTGLRIFVRAELPEGGRKRGPIEMYDSLRYLTVTAAALPGAPSDVAERSMELAALHAATFPITERASARRATPSEPTRLDDASLLRKAQSASNGARFTALWQGDAGAHGGDASRADLALCNALAFWTGDDEARMDRMFRQSGLMRPKWDEMRGGATYGQLTIARALSQPHEVYSPVKSLPIASAVAVAAPTRLGERSTQARTDGSSALQDDPSLDDVEPEKQARFRFISDVDVENMPPPTWLVGNLLPASRLSVVYGEYGSAKSFLVLDWALCVATGTAWQGNPVEQGCVAYVAGEGIGGMGKRIKAWKAQHEWNGASGLWLLDEPPQLLSVDDVLALQDALRALPTPPTLVIIDTLARSMAGGDENSAQDMGRAVAHAEVIRQTFGCHVLLVHHKPKNASGTRGSSALPGAADTLVDVSKDGDIITVSCEKQKDAAAFETVTLKLLVKALDPQDPESTSCVLMPTNERAKGKNKPRSLPTSQSSILAYLETELEGASFSKVCQVMMERYEMPERTVADALGKLKDAKRIINRSGFWGLIDE